MSSNYNYHRRQFDYNHPQPPLYQPDRYSPWKIHPTTEIGRERVNPPRSPYAYNAGHQPARQPSCWEPPPHRASQGYSDYDQPPPRRPSCWDPPRQRTDHCCPPPYSGPDMSPDSYVQPRNYYAEYRPWQPQYQSRSATKADRLLEALDRALDRMETRVDAIDRRVNKIRSSPQPDRDQADVSPYLRKIEYSPLRNTMASFGRSGFSPNDSSVPPRQRTKADQPLARQPSCWKPLTATTAADQVHQPYQPPPPLPRPDCHPQQPSPAPPLELLPNSVPGPSLSLPVVVPPPPPQRSSSYLSMTSHCRAAVPLPGVAAVPSSNLAPPAPSCSPDDDSGEESELLDEPPPPAVNSLPCSPCINRGEETFLDDDAEVDSIEEVKTVVASLVAALLTSQDVVENCLSEIGDALLRKFSKDSLCANERKLTFDSVFDDKSRDLLDPTQWELEIKDEARLQQPCTFDPGGEASPKLLLSTLVVASWFPP